MIKVRDFKKTYRHITVHQPHLDLPEKSILKGPNGCGKSTLFKALAGVISFEGRLEAPKSLFYLPVKAPLPHQPIQNYLAFSKGLGRVLFHDFFSVDEWPLLPNACSSGMRQKLRLIWALSWPSEGLLLDEPLQALDRASAAWVMRILNAWEKPVCIITHQAELYPDWPAVPWTH